MRLIDGHKLFNGDCLEVLPQVADGSVDMVLCDPPYGVTNCAWDTVVDLPQMWGQLRRVCKPGAAMVFTSAQPFTTTLIASNLKHFRFCWVWVKNKPTGFLHASKRPMGLHEDIPVFYQSSPTYNPQGLRDIRHEHRQSKTKQPKTRANGDAHYNTKPKNKNEFTNYPTTVLRFGKGAHQNKHHPTEKPVDLMKYLIRTYTDPGAVVLDFTMGSGTTGVACQQTDRFFVGIEKDPHYFQVACGRVRSAGDQQTFFTKDGWT